MVHEIESAQSCKEVAGDGVVRKLGYVSLHDASADVEATIVICIKVADNALNVWSSALQFGQLLFLAENAAPNRGIVMFSRVFGK